MIQLKSGEINQSQVRYVNIRKTMIEHLNSVYISLWYRTGSENLKKWLKFGNIDYKTKPVTRVSGD